MYLSKTGDVGQWTPEEPGKPEARAGRNATWAWSLLLLDIFTQPSAGKDIPYRAPLPSRFPGSFVRLGSNVSLPSTLSPHWKLAGLFIYIFLVLYSFPGCIDLLKEIKRFGKFFLWYISYIQFIYNIIYDIYQKNIWSIYIRVIYFFLAFFFIEIASWIWLNLVLELFHHARLWYTRHWYTIWYCPKSSYRSLRTQWDVECIHNLSAISWFPEHCLISYIWNSSFLFPISILRLKVCSLYNSRMLLVSVFPCRGSPKPDCD